MRVLCHSAIVCGCRLVVASLMVCYVGASAVIKAIAKTHRLCLKARDHIESVGKATIRLGRLHESAARAARGEA